MTKRTIVALSILTIATGCATKQYGRLQPLSSLEMSSYGCRDIAIELSKVDAFNDQIKDEARFNMKSALGVLGDYGIGNAMAKDAAEKSSLERKRQLQALSAQKGCNEALKPS